MSGATGGGSERPGGLAMLRHEELVMPAAVLLRPAAQLAAIRQLPYLPGDVILTTYSKSGTSWMAQLLDRLLYTEAQLMDRPPARLLETAPPEVTMALEAPRILTTHLRPRRFPTEFVENKGKVILLLRNPKDVAVSYYFHLRNSAMFSLQQSWDEFLQSYVAGEVPYGQYLDFLEDWHHVITATSNINVHVVYYEDLILDGLTSLRRLSVFLSCDKNDEELRAIYEACSIENLRRQASRQKAQVPPGQRDKDGNSVIYRKGVIGDWKNHFTVAQTEMYDALLESRLTHTGFRFVYEPSQ